MADEYKQLAQSRASGTDPVSLYSPGTDETVQVYARFANVTDKLAKVRIFHDDAGTTYDEDTAIAWDIEIKPGQVLTLGRDDDAIFMNSQLGNFAYRSSIENSITATLYGIISK